MFGEFFQQVCSDLVTDWKWDDPYTAITPQYDPNGDILNAIWDGYYDNKTPKETANHINFLKYGNDT